MPRALVDRIARHAGGVAATLEHELGRFTLAVDPALLHSAGDPVARRALGEGRGGTRCVCGVCV